MTLRRALFNFESATDNAKEATQQHILTFFERMEQDLPSVNLLQKNVTGSYNKAKETFACF